MNIKAIGVQTGFTSKGKYTNEAIKAASEIQQSNSVTSHLKPGNRFLSALSGIGFLILGALSVLGLNSCVSPTQDITKTENTDSNKPISPQESIAKSLSKYASTLNILIKDKDIGRSVLEHTIPTSISFADPDNYVYFLDLVNNPEDPNTIMYSGTLFSPSDKQKYPITRIYKDSGNPNILLFQDTVMGHQMPEQKYTNNASYVLRFSDGETTAISRETATKTPGTVAYCDPSGKEVYGYFSNYTITY